MSNRPDGTPGKKRPAPSAKTREPTAPMTLGNMRSLRPRSLDVSCTACGYHTTVNVNAWPDDTPVPSLGPRMRPPGRQCQAWLDAAAGRAWNAAAMTADLKAQIDSELYAALESLGADEELLAIVGSWRDTLDDAEVLSMLRDYKATGRTLQRPQ
jgi:hypothetical protein